MKIHAKYNLLLLLLILVVGCKTPSPEPVTNPGVESYLKNLISIMQANSINRKIIDWEKFTSNVLKKAAGAQTIDDEKITAAIVQALTDLQDSHSFFINNKGVYLLGLNRGDCTNNTPIVPILDKEIGYIKISSFGGSGLEANSFASTIQNTIQKTDNSDIKGWIVDLRGNSGGNMWPMLAGIGPILGEGTAGYFIDPDGDEFVWGYNNGSVIGVRVTPYSLLKPNPKVAVLTDQATASSGEAIAIAFRSRNNTRSFGLSTCGLSTANQGFSLADGSMLLLTVSNMADRTKKVYGKKVVPDVVENNQQIYLQQAIDWLKQ